MEGNVGERLTKLETMVSSQQQEIERVKAVYEVQNVMSKYEYYHSAGKHEETVQLFAQKTPGVWSEGPAGRYEGLEGVKKIFSVLKEREGDRVGLLVEHDLTTPVIEVAADGKTAKGVWLTPSFLIGIDKSSNEPNANLESVRYLVDFVKEEGQWKIWHMNMFNTYRFPYPIDNKIFEKPVSPPASTLKPDKPPTYHKPYSPTNIYELVPIPPEPYDTYIEE